MFRLKRTLFELAYLKLYESGELGRWIERALTDLADCTLCPRDCHINRLADRFAVCKTGRYAVVGSHFAHFGEEDCLGGWNGCTVGCCGLRKARNWELVANLESRELTWSDLLSVGHAR